MNSGKSLAATVVTALLSVQLTVVGAMQVLGAEPIRTNVAEMGYPSWFRVVVGVVQWACVVGLWTRWRFGSAVGLMVVLTGAAASHLRFGHDVERTAPAVVTLALVTLVAWWRRPSTSGSVLVGVREP